MHNQELLNDVSFIGTESNAVSYICTVQIHSYIIVRKNPWNDG